MSILFSLYQQFLLASLESFYPKLNNHSTDVFYRGLKSWVGNLNIEVGSFQSNVQAWEVTVPTQVHVYNQHAQERKTQEQTGTWEQELGLAGA